MKGFESYNVIISLDRALRSREKVVNFCPECGAEIWALPTRKCPKCRTPEMVHFLDHFPVFAPLPELERETWRSWAEMAQDLQVPIPECRDGSKGWLPINWELPVVIELVRKKYGVNVYVSKDNNWPTTARKLNFNEISLSPVREMDNNLSCVPQEG